MATAQQGLGDRSSEAPGSSVRVRPRRTGGVVTRPRRAGVTLASGLPWILPALVLCVGLIYYCIGYTGLISTWKWDGISPNPQHVGFGELYPAIPRPAVLGCRAPHGGLLRRHLHGPDLPGPHFRRATTLPNPAGRRLQSDHFHPGRPGAGHHGAGLSGHAGARRSVQPGAPRRWPRRRWRSRGSARHRRRYRR